MTLIDDEQKCDRAVERRRMLHHRLDTHSRRDAAAVRAATLRDVSCRRRANRSGAKAAESGRVVI